MLKVIIDKPYSIQYIQEKEPEVQPDSAVIRTRYVGICGSDLLKFTGKYKNLKYPVTPGHEYTGIIEKVSVRNYHGFKENDRVVVNPNLSCGKCLYCKENKNYLCKDLKTIGAGNLDGAMQAKTVVPLKNLYKLDENEDLKRFCLTEPLGVAIHAARLETVQGNILLFGLGGIGTLLTLYLKKAGKDFTLIEVSRQQMEIAQALGTNNSLLYSFVKTNLERYKNSFDVIFLNCPLTNEVIDLSVELSKKGGKIIVIGLPLEDILMDFTLLINKELKILPSFKFSDDDFNSALDFLKKNDDIFTQIKVKVFKMEDAFTAFEFKNNNPQFKVVLEYQ